MKLISLERIWDHAPHNGMTDLILYQNAMFCCFREGFGHTGEEGNGCIRILKSLDGKEWDSVALLKKKGFDLRDPHFSMMPDGRLMLTLGGSIYKKKYVGCRPQVAFSSDGIHWSKVHEIDLPEEWIWRIEWHEGLGYGFSYRMSNPKRRKAPWLLKLFRTQDGLTYTSLKEFKISNYPSEAVIRFLENGEALALLRRRDAAWIGNAPYPYQDWTWKSSKCCVGGPNMIILPDGTIWAGGRDYRKDQNDSLGYTIGRTVVGPLTKDSYTPLLYLESDGDNGYPGFVYKDGALFVSYYSSHEEKASIYLAKMI